MEKLTLQQLINQTGEALVQAGASSYYQKVFKTLTKQLLLYSHEQGTDSFSMDFGLQFLEDHYSMSSKIALKKWCTAYSRCINALAEYQRSGNVVLYLAMDKRAYTFPEGFRYSAEAYISHREDIGIIKKSNKIFSLYLERFFAFLSRKNIASLDTLSLKDVLDFMASLNCYEKPTINHTMRAVRYYLKYCHEHGLMEQEMFSKLPNPHYNRQSRLPSSYSANEGTKLLVNNCPADILKHWKLQRLSGFLHKDADCLVYPVDITKPETAYVTDPQAQPGNHQQNRIIPLPFWVFPVNRLQEPFDLFFFPGIGDRPISWYPDFGEQAGKIVSGKSLTE